MIRLPWKSLWSHSAPDSDEADGPKCKHDWTNWTDPVEHTATVTPSIWTGEGGQREVMTQSRRCLKCNMHERRYC